MEAEKNPKKKVSKQILMISGGIFVLTVAVLITGFWYWKKQMSADSSEQNEMMSADPEVQISEDTAEDLLLQAFESANKAEVIEEPVENTEAEESVVATDEEEAVTESEETDVLPQPMAEQAVEVQDITIQPDELAVFRCFDKEATEYQWEFYSTLDKKWEDVSIKQDFSVYEETDCLGRQVSCLSVPGNEEYEKLSVRCTAVFTDSENKVSEGCLFLFRDSIAEFSLLPVEAQAGEYLSHLELKAVITNVDETESELHGLQALAFCVNQDEEESTVHDEANSVTTETYTKIFKEVPYYLVEEGEQSVPVKLRMNDEILDAELVITGVDTKAPKLENIRADYAVSSHDAVATEVKIYASATDNYSRPSELKYAFGNNADDEESELSWTDRLPMSVEIKKNGIYYLFAKDAAGNLCSEELEIITVDMKAPVIEDISYINEGTTGGRIEVLASDKTKLEYNFHLSGNPSEKWQDEPSYQVTANGDYVVEVRDQAGNCTEGSITVTALDTKAPVIINIVDVESMPVQVESKSERIEVESVNVSSQSEVNERKNEEIAE